jgi:hypothetical protein
MRIAAEASMDKNYSSRRNWQDLLFWGDFYVQDYIADPESGLMPKPPKRRWQDLVLFWGFLGSGLHC